MSVSKKRAHFTPELFRFLRDLERNNKKDWFEKNRDRYVEQVRDPMLRFISDFGPRLGRISRQFVADPRPHGGSMFRVYRDTRFSGDKRPYKTVAAAQFRHRRGKDVHAPGFYLHLGAGEVFAGAGLWHPDGACLGKIRQAIVDDPKNWRRVLSSKAFKETLRRSGESLKRAPRGIDPDHPLIEDLKRKDFIAISDLTERAACSAGFIDRFSDICRAGSPFVRWLTRAVELEF